MLDILHSIYFSVGFSRTETHIYTIILSNLTSYALVIKRRRLMSFDSMMCMSCQRKLMNLIIDIARSKNWDLGH